MNATCEYCDTVYRNEDSSAPEQPARFCSEDCESCVNTCKQCFDEYFGDKGDGYCSDACEKQYDLECYGPKEPAPDPNAHDCCCLDCCQFPELH